MTNVLKQSLAPGEFAFKQGDLADGFYCLLSGEVEMVRTAPDGTVHVLNTLGAGEYFGEMSMLEGRSVAAAQAAALAHGFRLSAVGCRLTAVGCRLKCEHVPTGAGRA